MICPVCLSQLERFEFSFLGVPCWRYHCKGHYYHYKDKEFKSLCFTVRANVRDRSYLLYTWQAGGIPNLIEVTFTDLLQERSLHPPKNYLSPAEAYQFLQRYKNLVVFL